MTWWAWAGVLVMATVAFVALHLHRRKQAHRTILRLLRTHGELTGRQLVEYSKGVLAPGTVYVDLQALEDAGFIQRREAYQSPGRLPIYYFGISDEHDCYS